MQEETPSATVIPAEQPSAKAISPEPTTPKKKKKRRRKQKNVFDIPGVHKIVLSELAQKIIGCIAGNTVTSETPWMFVNKELVQDNLELHEESSIFLPLKKEILKFPRKQLLMGYIPDESRDFDEFYMCVTEAATDTVTDIIEKMKKEQEERLYNAINKVVKKWVSQGTEEEVDEAILKNNRPLIQVEVETKYPIFPSKVQFRLVNAEQRRDGYMELRCTDESIVNVRKARIDAYVQVAPQFVSTEAQTNCTYPTNSTTEYRYIVEGDPVKIFEKCKKRIVAYANENIENFSDILTVNGSINLYSDDYGSLSQEPALKKSQVAATEEVKEFMAFMDVNLCKEKMITDAVWHPMWTGIVAIAYADVSPKAYISGPSSDDKIMRAIYGVNPVLIWSTGDVLKPKLILETPREVFKLSFCDYDENILVGGLSNGQVIIWDIRNKLHKVEELEVLTSAQQKYRALMNSLMGWMKNIHDLALVRPTVLSDLRYSHSNMIVGISWLSPYYQYSKLGVLSELPEDYDRLNMQFVTSGRDGSILIWDLLRKPTLQPGGFKIKKLKRLKKKPSALLVDVSPFRPLHLNLRPVYKVTLSRPEDRSKPLIISTSSAKYCRTKYVEVNPDKNRKPFLSDRILYKPVLEREEEEVEPQLHIGTSDGYYMHLYWEGQDFDSGEVVNSQHCKLSSFGRYHDGPVNSVHSCDATKAILTVGGKIFAVWRDDFKDRPILWRRNRHMYISGNWNILQPYKFKTTLINGDVETWILFGSSKTPVVSLTYSSEYLSTSCIHPRKLKKNIIGAADRQGAFRLYALHDDSIRGTVDAKVKKFNEFINREVQRKKEFLEWQCEWNKRYAFWIQKREEEHKEMLRREEEARKKKEEEALEEKGMEKEPPKGPQPGKFIEWMKEQRRLDEEAKIRSTIITKKQLDTKELEKRRKPLQKLEEENQKKKQKQKKRLKEGETIFRDTVAMLFPEVVKEKPIPPPDPYAGGDLPDEIEGCYKDFPEIIVEAEDYIETHPFVYEFDWRKIVIAGKNRRRLLEPYNDAHYLRHVDRKYQREEEEKARILASQKPVEVPKPVVVEEDDDDFMFASVGEQTEE